ncbi:MAG: cupin-like domain-containing protein [Nostocales cyanobacterium]|nr:MAG: cupin-like domain-containing protein [Nostocales cyanobacterium]TAF19452.1 MAG: cupin-like domain-containing protein [Nostocales cyanobacterium]
MTINVEKSNLTTANYAIKRIHKPTIEEFKQATDSFSQPVIITGKLEEWKAFDSWSIDYLNKVIGDKELDINVSNKNKVFTFDSETGETLSSTKMKFTEFTNWLTQEKNSEQYYYLQQQSIKLVFPELLPDIEIPNYISQKSFMVANIWIGTGGNTTPLHWDAAQNILCQVRGRKRLLLFAPNQTEYLYPHSVDSKAPHLSYVNIDKPDFDKFPKFKQAQSIECVLEAGEMLFMPPFWWHQVYSLDQLNIAVNFWWKAQLKDYFTPQARNFIVKKPLIVLALLLQKPSP